MNSNGYASFEEIVAWVEARPMSAPFERHDVGSELGAYTNGEHFRKLVDHQIIEIVHTGKTGKTDPRVYRRIAPSVPRCSACGKFATFQHSGHRYCGNHHPEKLASRNKAIAEGQVRNNAERSKYVG